MSTVVSVDTFPLHSTMDHQHHINSLTQHVFSGVQHASMMLLVALLTAAVVLLLQSVKQLMPRMAICVAVSGICLSALLLVDCLTSSICALMI